MGIQLTLHEVHVGSHMLEVLVVATAEIVQSWIAILVMGKAVFGTFAVAGKLVAALPALLGE